MVLQKWNKFPAYFRFVYCFLFIGCLIKEFMHYAFSENICIRAINLWKSTKSIHTWGFILGEGERFWVALWMFNVFWSFFFAIIVVFGIVLTHLYLEPLYVYTLGWLGHLKNSVQIWKIKILFYDLLSGPMELVFQTIQKWDI